MTIGARVEEIRQEAVDVRSFSLAAIDGTLSPYAPGAHIDVHLPGGLTRQYSLCGPPEQGERYLIAVKLEPQSRGGSAAMHALSAGAVLQIGPPRNNFPLQEKASHHFLLAGGIGVTPLIAMARHLLASGASFELQYFVRSVEHAAFRDVLRAPTLREKVSFHCALEPERLRAYLRHLLWERKNGVHMYLCGPRPFMDLVEEVAAATWPPDTVHVEHFSANPCALSGPRASFEIVLKSSATRLHVPAESSIVQVLSEHGNYVPVSCEQGVCGTCLTGVLEGEPDHRDVFLTPEEKSGCRKIMPCVSRSKSEVLVLDL